MRFLLTSTRKPVVVETIESSIARDIQPKHPGMVWVENPSKDNNSEIIDCQVHPKHCPHFVCCRTPSNHPSALEGRYSWTEKLNTRVEGG